MSWETTTPAVFNSDGRVLTTSRYVADYFGKDHRNVLRDIDHLIADGAPPLNFEQGSHTLPATGSQAHRYYTMDRDGFTLLVMGLSLEAGTHRHLRRLGEDKNAPRPGVRLARTSSAGQSDGAG